MYADHEFTIAVITVIFALCCDFRQLPRCYVTAVIITKKCVQFRLLNGQFCVNICSAFLSWARIVAWLTLLPCRECIYRTMHSSFLDQTDSVYTATRPVTPVHVTTSMQLGHIRSRGKKASSVVSHSSVVSDVVEKTSTRRRSRIPCVETITTRRREGVGVVVEKMKTEEKLTWTFKRK